MVYMHGVNEPIKNTTLFPPKTNGTSDHEEAYETASGNKLAKVESKAQVSDSGEKKDWGKTNGTEEHEDAYEKASGNSSNNVTSEAKN